MTLAEAVNQAFVATKDLRGVGEVRLFRAFLDACVSVGAPAHIEEYHGSRSQVCFNGIGKNWGRGAKAQCELADLLIVCLSPKGNSPRATFLQAKYERRAPIRLSCPVAFKNYVANMEQWDLLARRPQIRGAHSRFAPPKELLSGAALPSVGSFGFFYQDHNGKPQVQYVVANALKPRQPYANREGKLERIGSGCIDRTVDGHVEAVARCCTVEFVSALERGVVGTPLSDSKGVADHVRTAVASLERPGRLANQLFAELDAGEVRANDAASFGARSLLIVRGECGGL